MTYGNLGFNPCFSYALRDNGMTRLVSSVSPTSYDPLHEYYEINSTQENSDLKYSSLILYILFD